jgi:hypothetical protein
MNLRRREIINRISINQTEEILPEKWEKSIPGLFYTEPVLNQMTAFLGMKKYNDFHFDK